MTHLLFDWILFANMLYYVTMIWLILFNVWLFKDWNNLDNSKWGEFCVAFSFLICFIVAGFR